MARNDNSTVPTTVTVDSFLATVDENKRSDAETLIALMQEISGEEPVMWGPSIIGFGSYHYRYASGREGDAARIGFSPRKAQHSLYLTCNAEEFAADLAQLGPHKTGKGCIYIKRLSDIDLTVLRGMITYAWENSGDYDATAGTATTP